jgi:hypothetical protein
MTATKTATKTELQIFIETAAGFWRAIGELDQVAARHGGDDLQREAYKHCGTLQKALDVAIRDWNGELDSEHPAVSVCVSQTRCVPWKTEACEIYTVLASPDSYCPTCASAKAADEAREAARG